MKKLLFEIETDDPSRVRELVEEALFPLEPRCLDTDYGIVCAALAAIGVPEEKNIRKMFAPEAGFFAASYGEDDGVIVVGCPNDRNLAFLFDCNLKFMEVR